MVQINKQIMPRKVNVNSLKALRGRRRLKSGERKVVSLSASKKAYSLYERKHGPVAEIESAPHGSKGEATKRWHQTRQDAKAAARNAKKALGKNKRSQAKSVKGGDELKNDYIAKQEASIKSADKVLAGNPNARARKIFENKKYNATLKRNAAKKGGFDDLTSQEVRKIKSILKTDHTLSPQQLRTRAKTELFAKSNNVSKDVAARIAKAKFTPKELIKYDVNRRVLSTERKRLDVLQQMHSKASGQAGKIKVGLDKKLGIKVKQGRSKADIAKEIAQVKTNINRRNSIVKGFEVKHGLKSNDVPKTIYGPKGLLKYKAPGRSSSIDTSKADRPTQDKFTEYESQFDSGATKTGVTQRGSTKTKIKQARSYEQVNEGGASIIEGKSQHGFTGHTRRRTREEAKLDLFNVKAKVKRRRS